MYFSMALGEKILKKINRKFNPSDTITFHYLSYDFLLKTNAEGNAIQMFMGRANEQGMIKGDRYARTMKFDRDGTLIKDHWERKGKAT